MSNSDEAAPDTLVDTGAQAGSVVDSVQEVLHHFLEAAAVEAVYGEPVRNGETLVVPTAEVVSAVGFGMGSGGGTASSRSPGGESKESTGSGGSGGGGGGGGRVLSRPVAVIVITPDHVRVEPIVDVTKLGLAALTAVGFMFMTMLRMSRRRSALPAIKDS
jgi:uncharacterized spore protein YtfJ